ncbi:hypothetical protein [Streptomyces sp. NPDC051561]|uniref:hypothetical protein n=1 Tax=Streptomyces sp. NPDC051561 TaxID=3365658 RepID=UPI0037942DBB
MNASQQHLLDAYRAAQHGTPTPPAPGRHDWQTVAELRDTVRDDLRFRAVTEGRPAHTYRRAALARTVAALMARLTAPFTSAARAPHTTAEARPRDTARGTTARGTTARGTAAQPRTSPARCN